MAVVKRGGERYSIMFSPFKTKQVKLALDVRTKSEAKAVEAMLLRACRTGDYAQLDATAREACVRMFTNQKWQLPPELGGQGKPTEELTLWRAVKLFLTSPEIRECPSRDRYEACIIHLTEHFGKEALVKNIRVPDLKAYRMYRLNEKAAPATINWEMATLSKMFGVLLEFEYVDVNPCKMLGKLSTKGNERQAYLSFEDVQRIAAKCPDWYQPILWTGFYTGMRRGEILGLTRKQVNLAKRIITLSPEDTKEAHWKRVPIHLDLVPMLQAVLDGPSLINGKVFPLRDDKGVRDLELETFKNPWGRACEALKREEILKEPHKKEEILKRPDPRFHDLRHTWKGNARRSGMHPEIEKAIMGHSERGRSVHERYGRISNEELLQAIDLMTFDHGSTDILASR